MGSNRDDRLRNDIVDAALKTEKDTLARLWPNATAWVLVNAKNLLQYWPSCGIIPQKALLSIKP